MPDFRPFGLLDFSTFVYSNSPTKNTGRFHRPDMTIANSWLSQSRDGCSSFFEEPDLIAKLGGLFIVLLRNGALKLAA